MRSACLMIGLLLLSSGLAALAWADAPVACGRAFWTVPPVREIPPPQSLLAGGWAEASAFSGLQGLSSRQLSRSQPLFWIGYDARAFYVGWRIPKWQGRPLSRAVREHDGPVWNDDGVEIFLDPRHTHSDYFQFLVNAVGTQAEARGRDLSWNGAWQAAVAEEEHAWSGLAAIPLATIGVSAIKPGEIWAANFAVDRSPGQRPEAFAPEEANLTWARLGSGTSYHEPASFGHLLFRPDIVQLTALGEPWHRAPRLSVFAPDARCRLELVPKPDSSGTRWSRETVPGRVDATPAETLTPGDYICSFEARKGEEPLAYVGAETRAAPLLDAQLEALSIRGTLSVRVRWEAPAPPERALVEAQLQDSTGHLVRQGRLELIRGASAAPLEWPIAELPPGVYRLVVAAPDIVPPQVVQQWQWPGRPAWLGTNIGRFDDDYVLQPWPPLQLKSRQPLRVRCWGRDYTFGALGLLTAVRSQGQELLAAPMRLRARVHGRDIRFSAPLQLTRQARGAIEFTSRGQSEGVMCQADGRLEFDGFIKWRLQLSGTPQTTLEELTLEIPFRREIARLLHHFPKPSVWINVQMERLNARAVPATGWASPFLYHVWIGDEERGLQWLTDSEQYWQPREPTQAIELVPERQATVLRLNMIGQPTPLTSPRQYLFAFQASPVKPKPPDYREWRYAQVGAYGIEKGSYRPPGPDRSISYPAAGHILVAQGTLEITVAPQFDSLAEGELNRSLFALVWPTDDPHNPARGVFFYWNQDDRGMRVVYREGHQYTLIRGARFPWKPGEAHTVAFTWGPQAAIFVDRQKLVDLPPGPLFKAPIDLEDAILKIGGPDCDFVVRQIRVSDCPLAPDEMGAGAAPLAAGPHTLLLDRFTTLISTGAERISQPRKARPGAVGKLSAAVVERPGQGLDLGRPSFRGSALDYYQQLGLRTIGFHEHWTDWQGFPRTSHTEELRSLLEACHQRHMRLLLYHSWQMADIAPEYPLYLKECEVVAPDRFLYRRQPTQLDYPVCAASAWADFMLDGMARLFTEFGPDGVYSDGLSYPGECANALHGCGYLSPDGQRHPTYNLFAVREFMKRLRYLMEQQNKPMLLVAHTSGQITLPTLAFADAYLDGEHLCGLPRPLRVPLDSFRAEFMGHNFGLPAYFLVYDWLAGMTTPEALGLCLLHDTELPWSYEAMAPIWNIWRDFGVAQAHFDGYWKPRPWLRAVPAGVAVSGYVKPNGQKLVVAVNTTERPITAVLRFREKQLKARDALTGQALEIHQGAIERTFEPWRLNLFWLEPAAGH